jgi:hypothetical protein
MTDSLTPFEALAAADRDYAARTAEDLLTALQAHIDVARADLAAKGTTSATFGPLARQLDQTLAEYHRHVQFIADITPGAPVPAAGGWCCTAPATALAGAVADGQGGWITSASHGRFGARDI